MRGLLQVAAALHPFSSPLGPSRRCYEGASRALSSRQDIDNGTASVRLVGYHAQGLLETMVTCMKLMSSCPVACYLTSYQVPKLIVLEV